jgi:hypothetical protein
VPHSTQLDKEPTATSMPESQAGVLVVRRHHLLVPFCPTRAPKPLQGTASEGYGSGSRAFAAVDSPQCPALRNRRIYYRRFPSRNLLMYLPISSA